MHIRIILEFFEKYKCHIFPFFLQSSRYVSNEQPCLKTTRLYDDLLLLSSFIFSISYSVLFHLVYIFKFLHSLHFFLIRFFPGFYQAQQESFCIHKYIISIYTQFTKLMNFCLNKNYDIFIPLFFLTQVKQNARFLIKKKNRYSTSNKDLLQYRELQSISYNNQQWKIILKIIYVYMYNNYLAVHLKH